MPDPAIPALAVEHLSVAIRRQVILDDVSLDVGQGEFFSILGPSGSGKTTLLRAVAGLVPTTAGRVLVNGTDVTHAKPGDRALGMVFQNYALFPHLDVGGNVSFPERVRGAGGEDARAAALRHLLGLGMGSLAGRFATATGDLAMGERQRVAVARATAVPRAVLLLDEPLSEVDARERHALRAQLRRLVREAGASVCYVTNNEEEAFALSDRLLVLRDGRVAQVGTPRALYDDPVDLFVASFLGSPGINAAPAEARLDRSVLDDESFLPRVPVAASRYVAAIRPERLSRAAGDDACITTRAILVERVGPRRSIVHLDAPAGWTWVCDAEDPPARGDIVRLGARKEDVLFFREGDGARLR